MINAHFIDGGRSLLICFLDTKLLCVGIFVTCSYPVQVCLARSGHYTNGPSCGKAIYCTKCTNSFKIEIKDIDKIPRGSSSWSPATNSLLVWNLMTGLDVYQLTEKCTRTRNFFFKLSEHPIIQVAWGFNGLCAISGSPFGDVFLWNVETGEQFQVLSHGVG
jgi:WD40 repeat protein